MKTTTSAGFGSVRVHSLSDEPGAAGPPLFLATARAAATGESGEIDYDLLETADDLTDAVTTLSPEDLRKATSR